MHVTSYTCRKDVPDVLAMDTSKHSKAKQSKKVGQRTTKREKGKEMLDYTSMITIYHCHRPPFCTRTVTSPLEVLVERETLLDCLMVCCCAYGLVDA